MISLIHSKNRKLRRKWPRFTWKWQKNSPSEGRLRPHCKNIIQKQHLIPLQRVFETDKSSSGQRTNRPPCSIQCIMATKFVLLLILFQKHVGRAPFLTKHLLCLPSVGATGFLLLAGERVRNFENFSEKNSKAVQVGPDLCFSLIQVKRFHHDRYSLSFTTHFHKNYFAQLTSRKDKILWALLQNASGLKNVFPRSLHRMK